jgi:hypothetical protein
MQGQSLLPICSGESDPHAHRDSVFCEYYNSWTHKHAYATMLRTRSEKIVVYHNDAVSELYDLERDPDEFENLWNRPDSSDRRSELVKACFDRSVLTMDPLPERKGAF